MTNVEKIPVELQKLQNWGVYKKVWDDKRQKFTKIPYNAMTDDKASSTNPEHWTTFDNAVKAMYENNEYAGLAFFFEKPYVGIDLDNIGEDLIDYYEGMRDTNIVHEFLTATKSYAEISQSGKGIHIIGKIDELPSDRRRKGDVEIYNEKRFFAITGDKFGDYDEVNWIEPAQMKHLFDKYLKSEASKIYEFNEEDIGNELSAYEIVDKACNAKNGETFRRLFEGGWESLYSSQSEADMAFANLLAFWTGRDFPKMDEIFRQSSLYRPKYDEKRGQTTYGGMLLNKAIAEAGQVYKPTKEDLTNWVIIKSQEDAKKDKVKNFYRYDDTGNAERFKDMYGDLVRWNGDISQWMVFNGINWEVDEGGVLIHNLVDTSVERIREENLPVPEEKLKSDDPDDIKLVEKAQENQMKWYTRSRNNAGKNNLKAELKSYLASNESAFDKEDMHFNTQEGVVDLTSGEVFEQEASQFNSKVSNVAFDPYAECPTWLKFLEQVIPDAETRDYVQKCVGYSLTASTREQCLFFLYGSGRNGKSVFIDIVKEIAGSYAGNIQADSLMVKRYNSGGHNEDVARLKGKRLVTSSEPNEGSRLDEGMIKQLTGEDMVTASYKGKHMFEYKPKYKLWIATNHKPYVRGTDEGIWRRIKIIPFLVTIPEDKVDPNLKAKLSTELQGILNWAIDGALKWQQEGLKESQAVKEASNEFRQEMDTLQIFIDEMCVLEEGAEVQSSALYACYKSWASTNNEHVMTHNKFGREVSKKFEKHRTKASVNFKGVKLRQVITIN